MQNDEGKNVDLYVPRKWYVEYNHYMNFSYTFFCSSATNRVVTSKDHASVQINIGVVDENGHYTGDYKTVTFCGTIRSNGTSDSAMNRYCIENKIMKDV